MYSKEDVQILFSALDRKDATMYGQLLTDESIFRFGNMNPATGKAAIHEAQSGFFQSIKGMSHELGRTWADSNSLVVEGKVTYTRHDDSSITLPFVDVFEFEGQKISATFIYMDINPLFNPNS